MNLATDLAQQTLKNCHFEPIFNTAAAALIAFQRFVRGFLNVIAIQLAAATEKADQWQKTPANWTK